MKKKTGFKAYEDTFFYYFFDFETKFSSINLSKNFEEINFFHKLVWFTKGTMDFEYKLRSGKIIYISDNSDFLQIQAFKPQFHEFQDFLLTVISQIKR